MSKKFDDLHEKIDAEHLRASERHDQLVALLASKVPVKKVAAKKVGKR